MNPLISRRPIKVKPEERRFRAPWKNALASPPIRNEGKTSGRQDYWVFDGKELRRATYSFFNKKWYSNCREVIEVIAYAPIVPPKLIEEILCECTSLEDWIIK